MDEIEFVPFVARRYRVPIQEASEEAALGEVGSNASGAADDREGHEGASRDEPGTTLDGSISWVQNNEVPDHEARDGEERGNVTAATSVASDVAVAHAPSLPEAPALENLVPETDQREELVAETRPRPCDHSVEIRTEAVRLAAIACGRALRHAVLLHPNVIAGFVDDALQSAGYPCAARVSVHPESVDRLRLSAEVIGDDRLEPGDIRIEFDGAEVGAEVGMRAGLLVAAAAQA